jgi:ferredoxin-NADP reductase
MFPPATPGDDVQLQNVSGSRRDYSLLGPSKDLFAYRIAIQREHGGRGGSLQFHRDLAVGDLVFVSYPQPGMRIDPTATRHVFIAGGIGVTAILGLLDGMDPCSDREVHYCVANRSQAAYLGALHATGARVIPRVKTRQSARRQPVDRTAVCWGDELPLWSEFAHGCDNGGDGRS